MASSGSQCGGGGGGGGQGGGQQQQHWQLSLLVDNDETVPEVDRSPTAGRGQQQQHLRAATTALEVSRLKQGCSHLKICCQHPACWAYVDPKNDKAKLQASACRSLVQATADLGHNTSSSSSLSCVRAQAQGHDDVHGSLAFEPRRRCAEQHSGGCVRSIGASCHLPQLWRCGGHPVRPLKRRPAQHDTPPTV